MNPRKRERLVQLTPSQNRPINSLAIELYRLSSNMLLCIDGGGRYFMSLMPVVGKEIAAGHHLTVKDTL